MNNYSLADAIYYMLLAVSLLLILQILYNNLVTYKKKLKDNLSVMLISCLVMCVFDMFWTSSEGKAGDGTCQYIGAIGYAISLLVFLIRFNRYFFEKLNIHIISKTFGFIIYELPTILFAVLFLTTPWTHIFYSIDESNYTEYMPAFYYVFMPVLFLYAISVVLVSIYMFLFRHKKNYDEFKVARSMVIFVLMAVGLYFLQEFTYGELGEEYLSMTVAFSTPLVFLTTDLSVYSHVKQEAKSAAIEADLNTAAKIQLDALPVKYPAFSEHPHVNLMAHMKTAKEVGGDFYDYFAIDDNRVCFLIADVSGKGIPAALCMMTAKTMIKDYSGICETTSDIFTMVNKKFCEQNKAGMFVTAWIGILDTETLVLQYTNAGHNYPMFSKAGEHFEIIKTVHGLFIGGLDGIKYKHAEIQLDHGDRLFLYTDGITEAHNEKNELYGNERLSASLDRLGNNLTPDAMRKLISDVDGFAGEAPQFDDMTMLMVEIV